MNSDLPLDRSTIFLSGFAPKRLIGEKVMEMSKKFANELLGRALSCHALQRRCPSRQRNRARSFAEAEGERP